MDKFSNQLVINWARQSLPQTVEVKLKEHKVLMGICITLLGLIFGGIALLFLASAVVSLKNKGWNTEVTRGLVGGIFFLGVFAAFGGGLLLLGRVTRRKFARYLDSDGVETRGGHKFCWGDLQYIDYKKVNTQMDRNQLAVSATRAAILAGVEKVTVALVFAGGTAVVPPLIQNQPEILGLLNSIPVQRRDDGKVREIPAGAVFATN
jgi:hypothetical protein